MFSQIIKPNNFVVSSKKNWGISAFPCGTYLLLENWQWTSWKQRTWRKWMLAAYQVIQPPAACCVVIFVPHSPPELATRQQLATTTDPFKICTKSTPLSRLISKILTWRSFCSKTGRGSRRRRRRSRKTPSIRTSMRVSALKFPLSKYR